MNKNANSQFHQLTRFFMTAAVRKFGIFLCAVLKQLILHPFFENLFVEYMNKNDNTQFGRLTRFFMIAAGSTGNRCTKIRRFLCAVLKRYNLPPFFENPFRWVHEQECQLPKKPLTMVNLGFEKNGCGSQPAQLRPFSDGGKCAY
jgi:hypothetical protein